jgi:hypothetical protein
MKRHEAITCLKEINNTCKNMSPDAVTLVNSQPDNPLSTGYQVHIKTVLDSETRQQVQSIIEKHGLAFKEEKDNVIIYQPKEIIKAT